MISSAVDSGTEVCAERFESVSIDPAGADNLVEHGFGLRNSLIPVGRRNPRRRNLVEFAHHWNDVRLAERNSLLDPRSPDREQDGKRSPGDQQGNHRAKDDPTTRDGTPNR